MDERIDIEVIDKVAKTIRPELFGIGEAAKNAYLQVAKLKRELGVTTAKQYASTIKEATAATNASVTAEKSASRASQDRARQATVTAKAIDAERASTERLAAVAARAVANKGIPQSAAMRGDRTAGSRSTVAAQNVAMGLGASGIADLVAITPAAEKAAESIAHVGTSSKLSAMSVRELLVLIREAIRGDFSRMAGSASILGQQLGLLGGLTFAGVAGFAALTVGVGLLANRFLEGAHEANVFNNTLRLTGNYAGLTASSYDEMAKSIAEATNTSVASNSQFILSLASSNRFTLDEIKKLTTAAEQLSTATSVSADEVIKDFAKMGDGPTAYAEIFQEKYPLIITPQLLAHIRLLEETGQTHKALEEVVNAVTTGIANNTTQETGIIVRGWRAATNAVSDYWHALLDIGKSSTTQEQINNLTGQIIKLQTNQNSALIRTASGDAYYDEQIKALTNQRSALQEVANTQEKAAKAQAEHTQKVAEGNEAAKHYNSTYRGLADSTYLYNNAVKDLDTTLSRMQANNDPGFAAANAARAATVEKLRKQYMPDAVRADHKAENAAAAAARRAQRELEAAAERAAKALAKTNRELSTELKLLQNPVFGVQGNINARIAQVTDSLANSGAKPTVKTLMMIRQSEELKPIVEEQRALFESIEGPINKYDVAVEAARKTLANYQRTGKDTAEVQSQINDYLAKAREDYLAATNPLYALNKARADELQLLKYYGQELEAQTEIQRRYNEEKAAQPGLTPDRKSIADQVRQDKAARDRQSFLGQLEQSGLDAQGQGVGGNQYILDNYDSLYKQIDAMRNGDVDSERRATAAKAALDQAYLNARLANTQSVLGQLSQLASSENRKLAAIGKAAAIAQATIDAYTAINKALATLPPPFNIAMAAAIGAAAFANVASIAGIKGFETGGYTGNGGRKQVAGAVHGQEYVMDAASTKRIGVANLDAMRSGRLNPPPAANNNGPRVTVINNAGANVQVRERSDGELEIMVDRRLEQKFGDTMQRHMSDPNSKASQSVGNNFKVRRNR